MENNLVWIGIILCEIAIFIGIVSLYVNCNRKEKPEIIFYKYTVRLRYRGSYSEDSEYVLTDIDGTDVLDAANKAKDYVARNGYFGSLTAEKNHDRIMELLIVDSVERE